MYTSLRTKTILELQEHRDEERTKQSSKFGSFLNSFLADVLLFSAALVTIILTFMVIHVVCGKSNLKTLVANIALQHIKGIEAADPRCQETYCTCKMQWYVIGMLLIILLGMIYLVTNRIKKSNMFGGCLFSNVTKVMLFISNMQSYAPINLSKIAGSISIHLFKIRGRLTPENIKLKKNWIWDVLEIDWKVVNMTLNGNEIILCRFLILFRLSKSDTRSIFSQGTEPKFVKPQAFTKVTLSLTLDKAMVGDLGESLWLNKFWFCSLRKYRPCVTFGK